MKYVTFFTCCLIGAVIIFYMLDHNKINKNPICGYNCPINSPHVHEDGSKYSVFYIRKIKGVLYLSGSRQLTPYINKETGTPYTY